jgi:two-component system, OmpR family, sensor histidine kinase CiaH
MSIFKTKRLALITSVYWFLLLYIVVALVWWFIALQQQNETISTLRLQNTATHNLANEKVEDVLYAKRRKTAQYIGEGAAFFGVIMIGAVFVYRATRNQFKLSQQQQNFMMAVTHELKTPIAVSRLNLETIQKRKLEEQQQQKLLNNTLQEINRLNSLCNNILLASQLEAGSYKVSKNEVDISSLAERVVRDFANRFPARKIESSIENNLFLTGEELLLEMLMNNLVENALKYSPVNGRVVVRLESKNRHLSFSVKDEGPGIPEDEKDKIFDKFYRVGNEVTRTAKGTGLGLYLCRKIAHDHHADITVYNDKTGAVFTVNFKP